MKKIIMLLMEVASLAEDIHAKTWEASQSTDLYMRECLGISNALQTIPGKLANNTSKLKEINKHIKKDSRKFKELKMILLI